MIIAILVGILCFIMGLVVGAGGLYLFARHEANRRNLERAREVAREKMREESRNTDESD